MSIVITQRGYYLYQNLIYHWKALWMTNILILKLTLYKTKCGQVMAIYTLFLGDIPIMANIIV